VLPEVNRRLLEVERTLSELRPRVDALSHQVESLHSRLEQADPQAALDIATGVRDSVRELSVDLAEQANRTSDALAELAAGR
jgi:hypothetical protein